MKHIWIGGVAPPERFNELTKLGDSQFAANNVQLLYVDGIEKNINDKMIIISSHFIPGFLKNRLLIFKKRVYENWIDVGFINIPIIKQATKLINVSREVKKIVKSNNGEELIFYIYSMTTPIMHAAKTIKKTAKRMNISRIKVVQIVPDLPQYMNFEKKNIIWRIAKKIDMKILFSLMKYIDKYVLFSKYMIKKLNIDKGKSIVIEGMIDVSNNDKILEKKEKVIMYAGGINEDYGVFKLIDSFIAANMKNYELQLYGPTSNASELNSKIKNYRNIKYMGLVPREKILEFEKKAMILVNPRAPFKDFTMYSFPSKTMEYLLSGTPVLMYRLKSIPSEYDDYLIYLDENDNNSLKNKLIEISKMNVTELCKMGNRAKNFIIKEKSNIIQCKKIIKFVE